MLWLGGKLWKVSSWGKKWKHLKKPSLSMERPAFDLLIKERYYCKRNIKSNLHFTFAVMYL